MRIIIIVILNVICMSACALNVISDDVAQWDFDHEIQFKEKKTSE